MNVPQRQPDYYLEPGHIYFTTEPSIVRTVLGSCVAVCLWDRKRHTGGMNHFVYPLVREATKATAKFGNVSTIRLVQLMDEAGCSRENIVAQIIGGATKESSDNGQMGVENARVARKVLERYGIAIVSMDVGGEMGRKVIFDVGTGEVAVLKVHKLRDADWLV